MELALVFIVLGVFAFIPASIAHWWKGRSLFNWWLLGFFFWLPALIASLVVEKKMRCPSCATSIPAKAGICMYCGTALTQAARVATAVEPPAQPAAAAPTQAPVPAWLPDPTTRHEYRYWDGDTWTDFVADGGKQLTDPLAGEPAPERDLVGGRA